MLYGSRFRGIRFGIPLRSALSGTGLIHLVPNQTRRKPHREKCLPVGKIIKEGNEFG